jgi:hypothetical protein
MANGPRTQMSRAGLLERLKSNYFSAASLTIRGAGWLAASSSRKVSVLQGMRLSAVYLALVTLPSSIFVQGPPSMDISSLKVYEVGESSVRLNRP